MGSLNLVDESWLFSVTQHNLEHLWQVRQIKERLREAVLEREEE